MTKLITIEQVAPIFGVALASLKKHRPRLGMPEPVAREWNKRLFSEQEIIEFSQKNDIADLFERMEQEEWSARKARNEARKRTGQRTAQRTVSLSSCNAARLW